MKTKRVRPVLVESNDIHSQLEIDSISIGKLSYEAKQYHCKNPQELILISLEDEKIEEGDTYFNVVSNEIVEVDFTIDYEQNHCKKVIARQSQIPLEYISKFIEQYNQNCVEDLDIEMEKCWINSDNVKGNSFTEVAKFEPSINDFDAVLIIQPKLTNGFVTIVERETCDKCKNTCKKISTITGEFGSCTEFEKESISYTEEEVRKLISEALYHFCPMNNHREEDEIDWFENNKKK